LHVANDDPRALSGEGNDGSGKSLKVKEKKKALRLYSSIESSQRTLFSTFRRSFFLPISYILSAFPTPAASLPWNANKANGTSSTSV